MPTYGNLESPPSWSDQKKERFLDTVMSQIFTGTKSGFYSPLMVSLDNKFVKDIPTAATDGLSLMFNLEFMLQQKENIRVSVFLHELLHVGYLHPLRTGSRTPKRWNYACDYKINLDLYEMGYELGKDWLFDLKYRGLSEEEIYELLPPEENLPPGMAGIGEDIKPIPVGKEDTIVSKVQAAIQQAKMVGQAGDVPGSIEEVIHGILKPVIPWERHFRRFFTDLIGIKSNWKRPNRRYRNVYMPSRKKDIGRLKSMNIYRDTSGSISTELNKRFTSELFYIWNTFRPEQLRIIQFDMIIQKDTIIKGRDEFNDYNIRGRLGTSLVPVHNHICQTKPDIAVIMSDMECHPMSQEGIDSIILWIRVGEHGHVPTFGEVINISRKGL